MALFEGLNIFHMLRIMHWLLERHTDISVDSLGYYCALAMQTEFADVTKVLVGSAPFTSLAGTDAGVGRPKHS